MKNLDEMYHATNIENLDVLKASYGRFGTGVYFTRDKKYAKAYGKLLIKAKIPENLKKIKYIGLLKFEPNLSWKEEEGLTSLRDYIEDDIVGIIYEDGTSEIVSYNDINIFKYL